MSIFFCSRYAIIVIGSAQFQFGDSEFFFSMRVLHGGKVSEVVVNNCSVLLKGDSFYCPIDVKAGVGFLIGSAA